MSAEKIRLDRDTVIHVENGRATVRSEKGEVLFYGSLNNIETLGKRLVDGVEKVRNPPPVQREHPRVWTGD